MIPHDPSPASLQPFRDGLVRALVTPPSGGAAPAAYLVDLKPLGALLQVSGLGQPLVLLTWLGAGPGEAELVERLRHVAASIQGPGSHIAIVGGDDRARALLGALGLGKRVSLHHVSPDGAVWTRGKSLRPLERAARQVAASPTPAAPFDASELAARRASLAAQEEAESAFMQTMRARKPRATVAIIVVCAALFGLKLLWGNSNPTDVRMGAVDGRLIRAGEWWRLLAGTFLHADPVHIGMNMWSLWALGRFLEPLFGTARFLVVYGLAALAGAAASSALHADGLSVGASGAIFGLLGAMAAVAFRRATLLPPTIAANLKQMLWQPIVLNIFISLLPQVDATAHAGGAAAGFVLVSSGLLVRGLPNAGMAPVRRREGWLFAAALAVAAALVSVGLALWHGRPWELVGTPSLVRQELPGTPFALSVPYGLRLRDVRPQAGATALVFGNLGRDPMVVAVEIEKAPDGALDDHDLDELSRPDPGAKLDGPPRRESLGGRDTLFSREVESSGMPHFRALTYRDGFRLRLEVGLLPGLSPGWEAVVPQIVGSLARRR